MATHTIGSLPPQIDRITNMATTAAQEPLTEEEIQQLIADLARNNFVASNQLEEAARQYREGSKTANPKSAVTQPVNLEVALRTTPSPKNGMVR